MNIEITIRNVYGNVLAYPASTAATLVAGISGKKTLSIMDLAYAAKLGHNVLFHGTREDVFTWTNWLNAAIGWLDHELAAVPA
jgi:hypothetical protein